MASNYFIDHFGNLSAWTPLIGTAAVAAGKIQGTTQGNVGANLVVNGEFTTNINGWDRGAADTFVIVDTAAEPGDASSGHGAANNNAIKLGGNTNAQALQYITKVLAANYINSCIMWAPSANTQVNAARFYVQGVVVDATVEDTWISAVITREAVAASELFDINCLTGALGDNAYFDALTVYRQNTVYLLSSGLWNSPNATITVSLPQPASPSVVPVGIIFRYTDSLNYWELRINPNTAGTDTSIVEVVAGVETVRASADVDFSVDSTTDSVKLALVGTVATVTVKKNGASTYSAACAYSTMATGLSSSQLGIMLYDTALGRISSFEVTQ
jgi:hypothetical protein